MPRQGPRGAQEQPGCQMSWKDQEEKYSLRLEMRMGAAPGAGLSQLSCSSSQLKSEHVHLQQLKRMRPRTGALSHSYCVPSARYTAGA